MKIFKRVNICILVVAGLVLLTVSQASARSKGDIVQSIKSRLDTVNQMKAAGVVGETNNGYLAFVGSAQKADIIAAENQDRKELYAIIAKEQKTSVSVIEKNMGVVKANRANGGEFLQTADGKWVKK